MLTTQFLCCLVSMVSQGVIASLEDIIDIIKLDDVANKIKIIKTSKIPFTLQKLYTPNFNNLKEATNSLDYIITEIENINDSDNSYVYNTFHQYGLYIIAVIVSYIIVHRIIKKLKTKCTKNIEQNVLNNQRVRCRGRIV